MIVALVIVALAFAAVALGIALRRRMVARPTPVHQILLPFTGRAISRRALDAALRLARAENAVLMPAYLAIVPLHLPLDSALPREASAVMPLLEAIEQRAEAQGVPVDSRIQRGRSYKHALLRLLEEESFDRVVVPATALPRAGFSGDDLVWLLEEAPAEVVILRPGPEDTRVVLGANGARSRLPQNHLRGAA